jgi:hypothetical protein
MPTKAYGVMMNKENTLKDIEFVRLLSFSNKSIAEQEQEFEKQTNKSRRTFFSYREILNLKSRHTPFKHKNRDGLCYFCSKKAKVIHHIDKNNKNNSNENLLDLCASCHTKIHRLMIIWVKNNLIKMGELK